MSPSAIGSRPIGRDHPVFVIAELSGNHGGDLGRALAIIDAAAEAGVDAIKLQTYTPDSLTIDLTNPPFVVPPGSPWAGRTLYDLYREAMTPWEWTGALFERAAGHGLLAFSTPFDRDAVRFLEELDPPAHKVASFELPDHELLRAVGSTGRPVILSTGLATEPEIDDAVQVLREAGAGDLILLRCNSAYPASPDEMDLAAIPVMRERWSVEVGLSDHTLSDTSAIVAVGLGATVLEKHLTLHRADGGPDASFSLEPAELGRLVTSVREAQRVVGHARFGPSASEEASVAFRRSLFFVRDVAAGQPIAADDIRAIRPGNGLAPKHLPELIGRRVRVDVARGTPVSWEQVDEAQ